MSDPEISVVIPARNEAVNLRELVPEISRALDGRRHEIVIVDDGSTDDTATVIADLAGRGAAVRRVPHRRSRGQSASVWSGALAAVAPIIATLDGDGQNDPRFILPLVAALADERIGLAAGQRVGRKDTVAKKVGSRIANRVRGAMLRDHTRDSGCGAKAFRREAFLRLPYFDTMHRFLPALFAGDGWAVAHVDVVDRPRVRGRSNYGIFDRLAVGIPDLFGVWWLLRRRRRSPFRVEQDPK